MFSPELLRECVDYNPDTGLFAWKTRPAHHFKPGRYGSEIVAKMWNKKYAGKQAFHHSNNRGYLSGAINGQNCTAHRAAFAWMTGRWPDWTIDHINNDRLDNRFCNLREATPAQQVMNSSKGDIIRGVATHKRQAGKVRYSASIRVHLGYFDTREEAGKAYEEAAARFHKGYNYRNNTGD